MLKLHFRLRDFACAALVLILSTFLTFHFIVQNRSAYAEDDTPIQRTGDEFFVTIYDQGTGQAMIVKTVEAAVGAVLERANIAFAETDIVEPSLETVITSDYNINIYRARPAIMIVGMERRYLMTASHDPQQIAREAGFTVYDGDTFSHEFNGNFLEAGAASTYRLERNGGRTLTLTESLPYPTETRLDPSLAKGERYLEQAGEDGRRVSIYAINFENNVEVSRELISEEIQLEPVPEIIVVGAKVSIPPEWEVCAGWAREAGISELELTPALDLMFRESGCRPDATNSYSGAYGIPQALPGSKMAAYGDDWETNPVTQIRWMSNYVLERYGGWQEALNFWWCTGVCSSRMGTVNKNGYWY